MNHPHHETTYTNILWLKWELVRQHYSWISLNDVSEKAAVWRWFYTIQQQQVGGLRTWCWWRAAKASGWGAGGSVFGRPDRCCPWPLWLCRGDTPGCGRLQERCCVCWFVDLLFTCRTSPSQARTYLFGWRGLLQRKQCSLPCPGVGVGVWRRGNRITIGWTASSQTINVKPLKSSVYFSSVYEHHKFPAFGRVYF